MAFDEKAFLTSLQEKVSAGETDWTAGVSGCNPPTLYTVSLGDYRADVVQLDDGFQLWFYDSMDRLAEIDVDQKFLDGISIPEVEPPGGVAITIDLEAKREAMAVAVAAYTKPIIVQEEINDGRVETGTGGDVAPDNSAGELLGG